jgi:hypothetical protein
LATELAAEGGDDGRVVGDLFESNKENIMKTKMQDEMLLKNVVATRSQLIRENFDFSQNGYICKRRDFFFFFWLICINAGKFPGLYV